MKFYELWKRIDNGEQPIILMNDGKVLDSAETKYALTKKYDEHEVVGLVLGNPTYVEIGGWL